MIIPPNNPDICIGPDPVGRAVRPLARASKIGDKADSKHVQDFSVFLRQGI
jgi:hypothetical protein